jgi:hypothetical protein
LTFNTGLRVGPYQLLSPVGAAWQADESRTALVVAGAKRRRASRKSIKHATVATAPTAGKGLWADFDGRVGRATSHQGKALIIQIEALVPPIGITRWEEKEAFETAHSTDAGAVFLARMEL